MNQSLAAQVKRWSRRYNRRRLAEEGLRLALGVILGAAVLVLGGGALHAFGVGTLEVVGLAVGGLVLWTLCLGPLAALRWMRRRRSPAEIALLVDTTLGTHDLVATAMAVENGSVAGEAALAELVLARAEREAPTLPVADIGVVVVPWAAVAAVGLFFVLNATTAATVVVMVERPDLIADLGLPNPLAPGDESVEVGLAAAEPEPPSKALSEELEAALGRDGTQLREDMERPGLSAEAREAYEEALTNLRKLLETSDGREALDATARADRALEKLEQLRRNAEEGAAGKPGMYDLESESDKELAKGFSEALERGDASEGARLGRELQRRAERSERASRDVGRALQRELETAARERAAHGARRGSMSKAERSKASRAAGRAARSLARGDRDRGAAEMRELVRDLSESARAAQRGGLPGEGTDSADRAVRQAADNLQRARKEQLEGMNRERAERAMAQASGEGGSSGERGESGSEASRGEAGEPGEAGSESGSSSSGSESSGGREGAEQGGGERGESGRGDSERGERGEGDSSRGEGSRGNGERSRGDGERAAGDGERGEGSPSERPGESGGSEGGTGTEGAGEPESASRGDSTGAEGEESGAGQTEGGTGEGEAEGRGRSGRPDGSESESEGAGITRSGGTHSGRPDTNPGPGSTHWGRQVEEPPPIADAPSEWIESSWDGGSESITSILDASDRGERGSAGWRELHYSYSSVAESVTEQEEIPLTRREYIRRYFEAIRPE